uniref:Alanine--glyoxylate aminotransferase n=1 Tax=Strigops habroptila TaxID=2489341 RepID=A0A672V1Z5_STRHB
MASNLLHVLPPQGLLRPLAMPERLLLGPGPSNVHPRILAAGGRQLLGHMHPEVLQVSCPGPQVTAQLKAHQNLTLPLPKCLPGASVHELLKPPGEYFTPWDIEEVSAGHGAGWWVQAGPGGSHLLLCFTQGLVRHKPLVLFITHGESSTGVLQPLEGLGELCHRSVHGCLLLVDAVASLGGAPIFMDQQEIDILYSGSQKVLNAPPGTAPISFSERAREKILGRKTKPPSFYLDMHWLANYWGCDGELRRYHHTPPINSFFSLREGLAMLAELGLEKSWEHHQLNCAQLCQGLRDLGLELFVKEEKARLPTVTTVRVPEGYDWKEIVAFLMDNHAIEISGGLGPSVGEVLRIGLMGCNSTSSNVDRVLHALRDALRCCHRSRL